MSKIIKYYIDIGCIYEGDDTISNSYKDHHNWNMKKYGLIGVLKLRINTKNKTKEEICFEQIFSPDLHKFTRRLVMDMICENNCRDFFREYCYADLVVTWNGRDFDLPIILGNIGFSKEYEKNYLNSIIKKDRDLLDLCILRDINVKGGLQEVVKRLNIEYDNKYFPRYVENELCFLKSFDFDTNKYNNYIKLVKHRNEFDVRTLPLLEEKLGYLYEPRSFIDKYHKRWL